LKSKEFIAQGMPQEERLTDASWFALSLRIILIVILHKKSPVKFQDAIFDFLFDESIRSDHHSVQSPGEVLQRFYFIFEKKLLYSKNEGYRTAEIPSAIRLFEDFATSNTHDVEMTGIEPVCRR